MLGSKGQTLMELLVVVSVSVIIIGALVFATISSLRNAQFSKNQAQATKLAQEGIEKARAGRDRNYPISISGVTLSSWNGSGNGDAIWDYHLSGNCDRPDLKPPAPCYFKIVPTADPRIEQLTNIGGFASGTSQDSFPDSLAETIPSTLFKRAVILSDDLNHDNNFSNDEWQNQKELTVLVRWSDFSGPHESRLTTILRKI